MKLETNEMKTNEMKTYQAEDIKITWVEAAKLWWCWVFRTTLSVMVVVMVVGGVGVFILSLLNVEKEFKSMPVAFTALVVGPFMTIFFLKKLLETKRDLIITWRETIKLFWWWYWRAMFLSLGAGFVFGLLNVFIIAEQEILSTAPSVVFGIFISIFFMKRLLEKQLMRATR